MARWATLVNIAGIDLSGCRAEVIDGQGFLSPYGGSVDWANDNTVKPQVFNREKKGIPFGIQFASTQISDLEDIVANIQTAQAAKESFRVQINDGIYALDVAVVPDYSTSWILFGKQSEGWYEGTVFRFISTGAWPSEL